MLTLGVRIDNLSKKEALVRATSFLSGTKSHTIFTPNPEMLVAAQSNAYLKDVLNKSDLNICDGTGLKFFSKVKEKIPGIEFLYHICELAEKEGRSTYLLGSASANTIKLAKEELLEKFPNLIIAGINPGPKLEIDKKLLYNTEENDLVIDDIIMTAPDILFVGFGHEKQELWIHEHLPNLPSVKIAMGVGGSFDIISGKLKRAPKMVSKFGFEWLWRLVLQPSRIKRIFTATIIFPYLCLTDR